MSGRRSTRSGVRVSSRAQMRLRWSTVIYVLVQVALAAWMAWPIYETARLAVIAAVAGLIGTSIPLLLAERRRSTWLAVPFAFAAYLVLVVPLAIPSALGTPLSVLFGLRDGLTSVVLGWKELITLQLPLGQYEAVLAPALLLMLLGSAAATAVAMAPGRVASAAVPVTLAMVLFGVAFGSTEGGAPLVVGGLRFGSATQVLVGLLAVAASFLWLAQRAHITRRSALAEARASAGVSSAGRTAAGVVFRRHALATALLIVALGGGLVAAPALGAITPPSTLRTGTEPMLVAGAATTPLSEYRGNFVSGVTNSVLFRLSGALPAGDRIRIASLDHWDGQQFTVGQDKTRFTRLPGGVPAPDSRAVTVTIGPALSGIWMPLPRSVSSAPIFGGPRAASLAASFYLDRDSGAAIDIDPSAPGSPGLRAGDSYTVQAAATPSVPLGPPGARSLLDLQGFPQLAGWIKAQGVPRSAAGFDKLVSLLRQRGYLSHSLEQDASSAAWIASLKGTAQYHFESTYSGHSTQRIEALFSQLLNQQNQVGATADDARLVAGIGDDEQFAVAAALLARVEGYDSRVVVGVRLAALPGSGVPACSTVCTSGDVAAWSEVRAPGSTDWNTVDAEPQFETSPTLEQAAVQLPKHPTVPQQPRVDSAEPQTAQRSDHAGVKSAAPTALGWLGALLPVLRAIGLGLGAAMMLLLPALVLVVAKRARRRFRRRAPVPEVAVVGAWAELIDNWVDGGIPQPRGTRRDQAERIGSDSARGLAVLVDHAVFAEHPPTRDAVVRAWAFVDGELGRRRATLGRWGYLRALVTPASFLRSSTLPTARGMLHLRRKEAL